MKIEMDNYMPILIPTLNRYEHLKRCVDSLRNNTGADYTELYISVDYPPSEQYIEGWKKVLEYVDTGITGFADVHIYKQKTNLGPYENEQFLKRQIENKYIGYIFSEDDNEFFPNFLDYINKGLKQFAEDEDALVVCGAGASGITAEKDFKIIKAFDFSAYGYGIWVYKEKQWMNNINKEYFIRLARNMGNCKKLYQYDYALFFSFVSLVLNKEAVYRTYTGEIACVDMVLRIYMFFEKKYSIFPLKQLSYNYGADGSGINCEKRPEPKRGISVYSSDCAKTYEFGDVHDIKPKYHENTIIVKNKLSIFFRYCICIFQLKLYFLVGEKNFDKIYKIIMRRKK